VVWGVGLQVLNCWDCGFKSRWEHACSSLVFCVCCVASVTGWSLNQRSRTGCVWYRNFKRWGLGLIWVVGPQKKINKNFHPLSAQSRHKLFKFFLLECSSYQTSFFHWNYVVKREDWIWNTVSEQNIMLKTVWCNTLKTVEGLISWLKISYSETLLFSSCYFTYLWISENTWVQIWVCIQPSLLTNCCPYV
jgi:hypothetical protein